MKQTMDEMTYCDDYESYDSSCYYFDCDQSIFARLDQNGSYTNKAIKRTVQGEINMAKPP